MTRRLVECVPNFSEGRDRSRVEAIAAAIGPGVLDIEMDADHHRSVITFVAPPDEAIGAAVRGVEAAIKLIELGRHEGVHPRIGAADVVPFVPLEGVTLGDCAVLAQALGEAIWQHLGVPVFLYGAAALRPEHRDLAGIRRRPEGVPDLGGPARHPTAGAVAVGAREFLIACNINLATTDADLARRIARRIRGSSGGFPFVKALGFALPSRGLTQVSMNLVDFERTPVEEVYRAVEREAASAGATIAGCELVGLLPRRAYEMAPGFWERCAGFSSRSILESRLGQR
ncbi:MAG: glutamate formimidoyltransferase [Acidobacteria bacterium]|nr:glutamate formimidoyltransferase [Acidobacteriota bacterium]